MGMFHLPKLVLFTSEEAHYSTLKFAAFLGIGEENVVLINTDDVGCMIPDRLEAAVLMQRELRTIPFLVIATVGK